MPGKKWTPERLKDIQVLIDQGLTNPEIASLMDVSKATIAVVSQKRLRGNPNYRIKKTKHKHLREEVMQYFLNHSAEETMLEFKLTKSEFKSISTVSYKNGIGLRKDNRTHNKWSAEELIFMLRHAGLKPRSWIAEKIERGNSRVIKEKLMSLKVNTKTLSGMTLSSYRTAFKLDPPIFIEGSAGPGRGKYSPTYFKIVPWVIIEHQIQQGEIDHYDIMKKIVNFFATFQIWIHGDDPVTSLFIAATTGHEAPIIERTFKK